MDYFIEPTFQYLLFGIPDHVIEGLVGLEEDAVGADNGQARGEVFKS